MDSCDLVVVGAGAAGLAAAIFAAEAARTATRSLKIVVLESAAKVGAKILISGGGRCNVTHEVVRADDFHGARTIVRNVLAAFDAQATVRWFHALGVPLKREETGKLFPVSNRARSVVDALLHRCAELDIQILTDRRVRGLRPADDGRSSMVVEHQHGALRADRVIMATGGRSVPKTGSDGAGWEMVSALGHRVSETHPALVPLVLGAGMFHADLSGLSQPVELSTFADGKLIDRRTGSLLWTHFGISGPVVMDASRHWVGARARGQAAELRCSFLPGQTFEAVEAKLIAAASGRPRAAVSRVLAEQLPDRVAVILARTVEIDPALPIGQVTRSQRRSLVHALTGFVLPVESDRGWNYAEVTAGGVPLEEIDYRTMESRKVPGLYLIGEMLDCDGRIGGFNFQWAWATGYLAGSAAARAAVQNHRA